MPHPARAFWLEAPGRGDIRPVELPQPGPDDVVVRTLYSAISRGTESLVFRGGVPVDQYEAMRAPFQQGEFPGPVKYGYLSVGVVERGPANLTGMTVFCLFPHQTRYVVPASAVLPVPDGVPPDRAVMAGNVETVVNALWDAAVLVGDRVVVIGAGVIGCIAARLVSQIPGTEVTLVDVDPAKAAIAGRLAVRFASPEGAPNGCDVAFHASATGAGLQTALDSLALDGRVIELSWYGDSPVTVELGGRFHSSRLGIVASQVGTVSPAQRGRRTAPDRRAMALSLLRDEAFDALISGHSPFDQLPDAISRIATGELPALCHVIDYDGRP